SEPMKVCVETAVRFYVMETLCTGTNTDLGQITVVCKLTCELTRQELCLPTLPMLVISDAFDSLTVQQCEKLFSFVEANVSVWKEPLFFTPSKNQVLRMCNDVLRRLSRSQNTIFCGRILLFLARFFPFSERSGLNLISEFNLENVTTFSANDNEETMDTSDVKEEGTSDIKEEKEEKKDESKPTLDPSLYSKFWALQDFFRNPIQCYQKEPWRLFTSYTADVIEAFSSFKLESEGRGGAEGGKAGDLPRFYSDMTPETGDADTTITDTLPDVKKIDQYFAKFLTNQRLLELQFSDSNFRRYVLVQLLILCHYLTAAIKFKQESLGDGETHWVHNTEQRVFALLKETPPEGEEFVESIKKILKREDFWNDWKNSGCPEIRDPAPPSALNGVGDLKNEDGAKEVKKGKKRKLGDLFREADARKKFVMANPEMTRLWNLCPDNIAATRQNKRDFIPSLESYFVKAVEQIHCGEEPVTDRLVHDSDFGWRGLRLLACRSPHFFTQSTAPIATLPEYLTTMIKKLAKDIPGLSLKLQQIQEKLASQQQQKKEQLEQQGQADAATPKQEDEEKIITEETENCDEEETQDDDNDRVELQPITTEEQAALAAKLASIGGDKWRQLTRKLGFQDDEVDYILEQKKGKVQDAALHFLQLWVENEGEEANKETIVYTLGGLKMQEIAESAFN
ncbi:Death domain, partial [Trinorchestia longiramus]